MIRTANFHSTYAFSKPRRQMQSTLLLLALSNQKMTTLQQLSTQAQTQLKVLLNPVS